MSISPQRQAELLGLCCVSDVLTGLARELEHARLLSLRVEQSLCGMASSAQQGDWLEDVQQVDMLQQHLAALRDFAAEIAREPSAHVLVPIDKALRHVSLNELRERLAGEIAEAGEAGVVALFANADP
ncbi:MAG: hypothetical protein ABUS48_06040 [Pseudomonadota bacterium]